MHTTIGILLRTHETRVSPTHRRGGVFGVLQKCEGRIRRLHRKCIAYAVSELLLSDINGQVLSYMGRVITEEIDVITLDNERWHYVEDSCSEEDIRLELIKFQRSNSFIVGWNLGLLFIALGIPVPEWTVLDLAADPYLR